MSKSVAPWASFSDTDVTVAAGTTVATVVGWAGSLTLFTLMAAVSVPNEVGCWVNVMVAVVELM